MGLEDYINGVAYNKGGAFYYADPDKNMFNGMSIMPYSIVGDPSSTTNNLNTTNYSPNWSGGLSGMFGQNGWFAPSVMGAIGTLGSLGAGLFNAFNSQRMLDMAEDQFDFQKAVANRNIANQAKILNNQYDSSAGVSAAMAGRNGTTNQSIIDRYKDVAKKKYVDGSYIG